MTVREIVDARDRRIRTLKQIAIEAFLAGYCEGQKDAATGTKKYVERVDEKGVTTWRKETP